jgi:excinuclease UvrABC helicase subunit UvrB
MDLVKDHSPSEEYTQAHEQYRGFVLYQRTQAAAAQAVENDQPECAINAVRQGLARIHAFFAEQGVGEQAENDGMVQHLRTIESSLREQYKVARTLQEQLDEAIAAEDYERAARLRDSMRNSSSESS